VNSDHTPLSAAYYEFDGDGLPTVQARRGDYDVNHYYTYDDAPRLTGEAIRELDGDLACGFEYEYDAAGERIRMTRDGSQHTYFTFNAAQQLVRSHHPDDTWAYFTYDEDGNTTAMECPAGGDAGPEGTTEYEWNQDNLIVAATVPGIETANAFEWNAAQQRTRKTDSGGDVWFVRDGQKMVSERLSGGSSRARYANEGPSLYSALLSDRRGGATRWPLFDMLGTVHSFAAANETLSGSALRDAFGPELASTGSLPGPFGYVGALGYYHDPDLAMPLLSIRHYAPRRGMFISRDPVLTFDPYAYGGSLPPYVADPTGLSRQPPPEHGFALLRSSVTWWVNGLVDWVQDEARAIGPWVPTILMLPRLPGLLAQAALDAIVKLQYRAYHWLAMQVPLCLMLAAGLHLNVKTWANFAAVAGLGACWIPCECRNWLCGSGWAAGLRGTGGVHGYTGVDFGVFIDAGLAFLHSPDLCQGPGGVRKPQDPFAVGNVVNVSHLHVDLGGSHMQSPHPGDWSWWGFGIGWGYSTATFGAGVPALRIGATKPPHMWSCAGLPPFP